MARNDPVDARTTLALAERGDPIAAGELFPLLYREMHDLALRIVPGDAKRATLQPTAVVHEAYVRLAGMSPGDWHDHAHFLAIAARAMRQVLADHVRHRKAQKRGGGWDQVTLDEAVKVTEQAAVDADAIDDALCRLAELDERKARVVELKFFGGLGNEEIATHLGVSRSTVADDWAVARAWLKSELVADDG